MCQVTEKDEYRTILELQDVTYIYEGETLPVWEHLSCSFFAGKIHALIGPSGCGKSSVLSLIDGLIPHMYEGKLEGRVLLRGEEITDMLPRYRCDRIGLVMQNPESQFCTFTVEEELAFGMENLGLSEAEMEMRIRETLDFVGMTDYEKVELDQLSGGQKQKIAIASVLVTKPEILLLDEPTANLDPNSRKQIFRLIVDISKAENMTIVIVEHNIEEIIDEVDWILEMNSNGQVIRDCPRGEAEDLFQPASAADEVQCNAPQSSRAGDEVVLDIAHLQFAYPLPGRKREKGKQILRDLCMQVHRQDFLAIVGENGVGKSTLMKLIFKVQQPDAGEIKLFDQRIETYQAKKLYNLIGLVFQNPENQFITNTVWDELMFSLKRVKCSQEEKDRRVHEMLERFHLEQEKEKSPFVLSQGQKRRLSVASMLLTDQEILFLDEPTYGQDEENRQELMKDMQQLIRAGITIVMITHDLALVRQYATRVVEIEKGTVTRDLPTEDYFADLRHAEMLSDTRKAR